MHQLNKLEDKFLTLMDNYEWISFMNYYKSHQVFFTDSQISNKLLFQYFRFGPVHPDNLYFDAVYDCTDYDVEHFTMYISLPLVLFTWIIDQQIKTLINFTRYSAHRGLTIL